MSEKEEERERVEVGNGILEVGNGKAPYKLLLCQPVNGLGHFAF